MHLCTYLGLPCLESKYVHICIHIWISPVEKSLFLAPAWISPMEKCKLAPKIRISPSEKSIYACIYAHIRCIQICACVQADMDFSDGETRVFDTSLDFSIQFGEIQTGAKHIDFSYGEILILGDCLDFSNGEIQAGAKNTDFAIVEIHICMHICTYLGSPNVCMCANRNGFLRCRNPSC